MKIGFIIERNTYHRLFSPIIDEALRRGHEVVCMHNYAQPKTGMKGYQFPDLESVPAYRFGTPEIISFNGNDDFRKIVRTHKIETLLSINFYQNDFNLYNILKKEGIYWVAIQQMLDMMPFSEYLSIPDRYLLYSDIWLDWAYYYLSNKGSIGEQGVSDYKEKLKGKVKSIGYLELDQLNMIRPEDVKREWGIPEDKTVVLLLPFEFTNVENRFYSSFIYGMNNPFLQLPVTLLSLKPRYIKHIINGWNDINVVRSIKKFCEKNDAYLLVKARLKSPSRNYLSSIADKVIYDVDFYPADILKCLSISDICINFLSTTVTEAIPAGVPNICISPDIQDFASTSSLKSIFKIGKELFDFDGASYMLSISELIEILPNKSIEDFPLVPERQKEYIKKFLSYSDGRSSSRALDEIERMVMHRQ